LLEATSHCHARERGHPETRLNTGFRHAPE
jgi:hypothetical protein